MCMKSSWPLNSIFIFIALLSSGCSLLQIAGLNPKPTPPFEGGLMIQMPTGAVWGGPIRDVSQMSLTGANANNVQDSEDFEFSQLCRGGHQIREVTQTIRVIRSPIPKSLPLEAAQKMQQDRKRAEEGIVAHFYLYASEPSNILTVKDAESYQASRSYALRGSRGDDLKEAFYSSSAMIDGIASSNRFVFLQPSDSNMIYLVPNRFLELHWGTRYIDAGVYLNRPVPGSSGLFAMTTERPLQVRNLSSEPINQVSVLTPARNKALYNFRKNFTVLMSDQKMQEELPELRSFFLNPDGSISTAKAVRSKEQFWKLYFQKFTTVKKVRRDNAAFEDYEVSLNLDLFCSYGRQVKDLLSK